MELSQIYDREFFCIPVSLGKPWWKLRETMVETMVETMTDPTDPEYLSIFPELGRKVFLHFSRAFQAER